MSSQGREEKHGYAAAVVFVETWISQGALENQQDVRVHEHMCVRVCVSVRVHVWCVLRGGFIVRNWLMCWGSWQAESLQVASRPEATWWPIPSFSEMVRLLCIQALTYWVRPTHSMEGNPPTQSLLF